MGIDRPSTGVNGLPRGGSFALIASRRRPKALRSCQMIAGPLKPIYQHLEQVQADMDPEERLRALGAMESGLKDLLGRTRTYMNDTHLELGASPERVGTDQR